MANALLGAVTAAALASKLASRDASSALTAYALQSAVDTFSEVDSKIATALLGKAEVVRNVCLYYPINFRIWVPKPCKTAKFSNQLNVFPMSPVFVTTPFLVQKALKTANSEKCVFSCQTLKVVPEPPSSLVFRRKPAPRVRRAPNSVFCPEKPANSSPLNPSPLVTASSPLAFWVQKCAKPGPVPELLLRRAAEVQARSPTARRGGPSARRACHH